MNAANLNLVNVSVKVRTTPDGPIRRFRLVQVEGEDLFETLMSQLRSLFTFEMRGQVSYIDADGDQIVVSSTPELLEAIRLSQSVLTFYWKEIEEKKSCENGSMVVCKNLEEEEEELRPGQGRGRGRGRGGWRGRGQHRIGVGRVGNENECLWNSSNWDERFDRKRERIEEKINILREKDDPEGKWAGKLEKLERKLEFLELKKEYVTKKKQEKAACGDMKKEMRKQFCLQKRLSNIREAKVRIERKQQEIRIRLERVCSGDGIPNVEKRKEHLSEHLNKLEERYAMLLSREQEVENLLNGINESNGQEIEMMELEKDTQYQSQQPWKRRKEKEFSEGNNQTIHF